MTLPVLHSAACPPSGWHYLYYNGAATYTLPESLYGENIVLANCVADAQRYPVISLMITLHNMNQHSFARGGLSSTVMLLATGKCVGTGYRRQGFEQAWRDAGRDLVR